MVEPKIQPAGAVLLLQEAFRVHTKESAKQLHGNYWKDYYNPRRVLKPDTILQDPQKSRLLVDAVKQALDQLTLKERNILSYRLNLEDPNARVRTLRETGGGFDLSGTSISLIIDEAFRKLSHPSIARPLTDFLPEEIRPHWAFSYPTND